MRELTQMELEQVDGGVAPVVVVPIVIGVVVLAGLALLAYGVYNDCSGSLELNEQGLKIEVQCPAKPDGGG
jgi:lactobin A/cerein 7B family class IIb bacteriocin